jgi:hypothetical protein
MFVNLASVDEESEDGFIAGSQTPTPSSNRETVIEGEDDGGLHFGRYSTTPSVYSRRAKTKSMRKYRRDNQTYCGTPGDSKCLIF